MIEFDESTPFLYENGFYQTSHPSRMGKLLAHYELYKRIAGLPGHVVECGVFKAASLIRWATFRHVLESADSRRIVGFDAFGAFPDPDGNADRAFAAKFEAEAGTGLSVEQVKHVLARKGFSGVELVAGDVCETVPSYANAHPELRIALLHIDVDVYEPSRVALEVLGPRMVRGGLIVFDDYGTVGGETRAADEFLAANPTLRIEKLPISHIPAFVVASAS